MTTGMRYITSPWFPGRLFPRAGRPGIYRRRVGHVESIGKGVQWAKWDGLQWLMASQKRDDAESETRPSPRQLEYDWQGTCPAPVLGTSLGVLLTYPFKEKHPNGLV